MEKLQELKEIFKVGDKYSLYYIDEMMAMSHCQQITVKRLSDDIVVYVLKGKRKERALRLQRRSYQSAPMLPYKGGIFQGWDQPIKCDTEFRYGVMRGNACYNFVGTPLEIQVWIETGQLNPFFDKSSVVAIADQQSSSNSNNETVVFPDEVEPGRHAVIDRILAQAS